MLIDRAHELRNILNYHAQKFDDEEALAVPEFFDEWEPGVDYIKDMKIRYGGKLYRVLQSHLSQKTWTPTDAPSLFALVLTKPDEILPWVQPGSTNPYMKGDKVTHKGKTWESLIDNNVWEPGAVGTQNLWKEIN